MARHAPMILALFFVLATLICLISALTFFDPHGPFAIIWRVKPAEYSQMLDLGPMLAWGFLALAAVMATAAIGCWRHRLWGWWTAMAIFGVNALADGARLASPTWVEGLTGLVVVAIILGLMTRPGVRARFIPA